MILAFLSFGVLILYAVLSRIQARRLDRTIRGLSLYAANLEGQLKQSHDNSLRMGEIAREAINEAAKAVNLKSEEVWSCPVLDSPTQTQSTYITPIAANCSRCGVSVRHFPFMFPVHCPACRTLIDPVLDNPPEF